MTTPTYPDITVYGALWCPDCRRSKQFLAEHRIPYRWIDIEQEPDAQETVRRLNDGRQIIPTIVFHDGGPVLAEPSNAELAARLGIIPQASRSYYDLIIIGAGPAGLTAAIAGSVLLIGGAHLDYLAPHWPAILAQHGVPAGLHAALAVMAVAAGIYGVGRATGLADLGSRVDLAERSVRRGEGDRDLADALRRDAEGDWE